MRNLARRPKTFSGEFVWNFTPCCPGLRAVLQQLAIVSPSLLESHALLELFPARSVIPVANDAAPSWSPCNPTDACVALIGACSMAYNSPGALPGGPVRSGWVGEVHFGSDCTFMLLLRAPSSVLRLRIKPASPLPAVKLK